MVSPLAGYKSLEHSLLETDQAPKIYPVCDPPVELQPNLTYPEQIMLWAICAVGHRVQIDFVKGALCLNVAAGFCIHSEMEGIMIICDRLSLSVMLCV